MLLILRWRRHRAFQLIQKTLHSGTTIFCPLRSVPLRFVLCCGCQCDPWVGSIFLYIVGNTARWQWRCCILCREEISKYMVLYLTFLHYLHHYWCEQACVYMFTCTGVRWGVLLYSIELQKKAVQFRQVAAQGRSHGCG